MNKKPIVKLEAGLAGRYKMWVGKCDENGDPIESTRRAVTGWFDNLILNQGRNHIGNRVDYMFACQVGTGNAAPVVGNTSLATYVGGTSTEQTNTTFTNGVEPYYGSRTVTWRFAQGVATGTLAEVGVGSQTATGNLFSRALIVTAAGVPTTIIVAADEFLDVAYQLRLYPPTADYNTSFAISGPTYTVVGRAAEVTVGTWGNIIGETYTSGWFHAQFNWSKAYDGALGAITGSPTGSNDNATSVTDKSYSNGNYYIDVDYAWGLNDGNFAGEISAIRYTSFIGQYQLSYSPDIPKDNTKLLDLTLRIAWANKTIGLITDTTISAQASDNSYNDSGNGFFAAAFEVGDVVDVTGFTGDVANNITGGTIGTLTAGKMTIDAPEGDDIVDDAAGESVTITKVG